MTISAEHLQLSRAALDALRDTANYLPPVYGGMAQMLRNVLDHPEQHWPHPVYLLDPHDVDANDTLSEAELVGWQYLVTTDGKRNYAIEVQGGPGGEDCEFSKIDSGPMVDGLCRALADQELRQQLSAGQFRLAVVVLNELDALAVWLQADEAEQQRIVAVEPAPPALKPWPAVYTIKEFESALQDKAQRQL